MSPQPARDAADTVLTHLKPDGPPADSETVRPGSPVTDLSATRIHVAMTLDRLRAVGHHPIIGAWPSLLVVTSTASLQLDPANGLSSEEALRISGRLLLEVTRWHEAIRCHDSALAADNEGRMSWTSC